MRKIGKLMIVFCLCAVFLAGCGEAKVPEIVSTTTVEVGQDGQITLWLIGEFDNADYTLSELASIAREEVARFNTSRGAGTTEAVLIEKVEAVPDGGKKVAVVYKFPGWKECTEFIGNDLFFGTNQLYYGTVGDAGSNGYDTGVSLRNVKDNTLLSGEGLAQLSGQKVVITDLGANIYCPGRVTHISDGATVNEDGSINSFNAEGLVYILLK